MPEEVLIITMFAIMAGTIMTVTRMILGYRERTRFGHGTKQTATDQSMTTSQLDRMIRSAVAETVDPLAKRLDRLEGKPRTETRSIPEKTGVLDIEDHELDSYAPEEEPARRSRIR